MSLSRQGIQSSVAVLPFEVVGAKGEDLQAFCDGLVEDVSSRLRSLDRVKVAPRTSARAVTKHTVREIGRQLQVSFVLEGSVQRAGEHVRVIANLIEAELERHALPPSWRADRQLSR